ncbi:hypothetical protein D3C81_1902170 [compost metagenome]
MTFQFLRALQRGQRGQGDQAAGFQRQAFAIPHPAPGMFVDEVLQRLGELGGIAQCAVDEGVAHDFPAYL